MKIQCLDWDTEFFAIKVGKIDILNENDFNINEFKNDASDEAYELVYVLTYGKMLSWKTIQNSGIELVDIILTMQKKFTKSNYHDNDYKFLQELSKEELQGCYFIAEQTSKVSRFFKEIKIGPGLTKKLYRAWIDNTLNKSISDGLFIEKRNNTVAGIHIIKTDIKNKVGYFTLTGVDPSYKRMGIGKKLWMESFAYWAKESDIEIIKSPFSFQNMESFNFHLKMGFNKIDEIKYVYHYRKTN